MKMIKLTGAEGPSRVDYYFNPERIVGLIKDDVVEGTYVVTDTKVEVLAELNDAKKIGEQVYRPRIVFAGAEQAGVEVQETPEQIIKMLEDL